MKVKNILSVILLLSVLLSTFTFTAFAKEKDNYVIITIEDYGKRVGDGGDFPSALGKIVDKQKVKIAKNDTIASATLRLLKSKGIKSSYSGSAVYGGGFYLESIDNFTTQNGTKVSDGYGLGEFSTGSDSGWMVSYNNWFINKGASEFYVNNGDVIKWQYTASGLGKDIGSDFDNPSAEITGLYISSGVLSPEFSTTITDYTLTLSEKIKSISIEAKQKNYCSKVTYSSNGKNYRPLENIPVSDGRKIKIESVFFQQDTEKQVDTDFVNITIKYNKKTPAKNNVEKEKKAIKNNNSDSNNSNIENKIKSEDSIAEENTTVGKIENNSDIENKIATTNNSRQKDNSVSEIKNQQTTTANTTVEYDIKNNSDLEKTDGSNTDTELNTIYLVIMILAGAVIVLFAICMMNYYKKRKER